MVTLTKHIGVTSGDGYTRAVDEISQSFHKNWPLLEYARWLQGSLLNKLSVCASINEDMCGQVS